MKFLIHTPTDIAIRRFNNSAAAVIHPTSISVNGKVVLTGIIGEDYLIIKTVPPAGTWADESWKYVHGEWSVVDEAKVANVTNQHAQHGRDLVRQEKTKALDSAVVQYNGVMYDADEVSQNRILRTIMTIDEVDEVPWIAADNYTHNVTRGDLVEILKLARINQSQLWLN